MSKQAKHVISLKTTTPLKEIRIDVMYFKGRGYFLYATPVEIDPGNPAVWSTILMRDRNALIEKASRFSAKRLDELAFKVGTSRLAQKLSRQVAEQEGLTLGNPDITARLEYLRGELAAQRISYDETHELQTLALYIDPGDVDLLEPAGVPEFEDEWEQVDPYGAWKAAFLDQYKTRFGITFADGGGDEDEIRKYYDRGSSTTDACNDQRDRYSLTELGGLA